MVAAMEIMKGAVGSSDQRDRQKTWAVVNGSVKNGLESSGEILMMAMVHASLDACTRKFSNPPLEGHCSSTNSFI